MNRNGYFILLFAWLLKFAAAAQPAYTLRILATDGQQGVLEKNIRYKTNHSDSTSVFETLKSVIRQLHDQALIEASVDTITQTDSVFTALLHIGPPFMWLQLNAEKRLTEPLHAAGFRAKAFQDRPVQWSQWRKIQSNLLRQYENKGYPFAQVSLGNIDIEEARIAATIEVQPGPLFLFGKLETEGNLRLSRQYLQRYLGIVPGDPYHHEKVLQMRDRLRALPFVSLRQDPLIVFRQDSTADISLLLDPRKAGRFDFLIGVLPNSSQVGRMLITGSLYADFHNQLGQGERIAASFERLRPETQQLSMLFQYPYVLQLPFGMDAQFQLYKRDTTFLNLEYSLGANYPLEGASYWKAFWQHRSTRLTGIDEARLLNTRRLPAQLDVSNNAFGLETTQYRTDYRLNPRRGWNVSLRASAGAKRVRPNNRITALGLGELYDSITLNSAQYRIEWSGEYFLPFLSNAAFKCGLQGGWLLSSEPVFRNEQFRIGGNKLLRGFDEEFFFATGYAVASTELRLLIGPNSRIYSFADLGRVEDRSSSSNDLFYALGFGAGIALETKAGILGLSLALGTRTGTPLDFSAPKVHVGYLGLF